MQTSSKLMAFAVVAAAVSASAAEAKTTVDSKRDGRTFVTAPGTRVAVLPKRTRVKVEAPFTNVLVDTAENRVRIRVPHYNGDISW